MNKAIGGCQTSEVTVCLQSCAQGSIAKILFVDLRATETQGRSRTPCIEICDIGPVVSMFFGGPCREDFECARIGTDLEQPRDLAVATLAINRSHTA